jgi:Na+-transporting NADH:ubiquinone oxidoreductase subunit NqrB
MLTIYSKVAYFIAAIQIISNILDIIAFTQINKEMEKMCSSSQQGFPNQLPDQFINACSTISKASLIYIIVGTIIVTIFVVCKKKNILFIIKKKRSF